MSKNLNLSDDQQAIIHHAFQIELNYIDDAYSKGISLGYYDHREYTKAYSKVFSTYHLVCQSLGIKEEMYNPFGEK